MSFIDIIKAFIPLIIILCLLYGVLIVIKKYGSSIKGNKQSGVLIKVLSSQMIMPKKFISIIRVDDKLLVLGVSESSITLLKELEPSEEIEQTYVNPKKDNNFIELLKNNFGLR
jgi:flagellar protein FliO/FliZ